MFRTNGILAPSGTCASGAFKENSILTWLTTNVILKIIQPLSQKKGNNNDKKIPTVTVGGISRLFTYLAGGS